MLHRSASTRADANAFTILEVLVAAFLIALAMGSIMAINTHAVQTLRATRQAAASSQVLQQRIEMVRGKPWPEVSSSAALQVLMSTATESEKELTDAQMIETVKVTVPVPSPNGPTAGATAFSVRRQNGVASADIPLDLGVQPALLFEGSLTWHDPHGLHRRFVRSMICRAGLTRSGIFGSPLGRAGGNTPSLPPP
jgi:type II secretory pathway pseudopilin PulG